MRLTTLCYIEKNGCWLMMQRNKKDHDENAGKWIGIGGHLEEDESPEECMLREIREETGLDVCDLRLRGLITFILPDWGNELTFLYTAKTEGNVSERYLQGDEGTLAWIPVSEVGRLELWEGDRQFLPLLQRDTGCFSMKLVYQAGGRLSEALLNGAKIP